MDPSNSAHPQPPPRSTLAPALHQPQPLPSSSPLSSDDHSNLSPPPPLYLPHPHTTSFPPQPPLHPSPAQPIPKHSSLSPAGFVSPDPSDLDHSQPSISDPNAKPSHLRAPVIDDQLSRHFPELANMGKEDLQDLLNDPEYFHAVFFRLGQVQQTMESHQSLIAANQSLAEKNLALRPQLERLRDEAGAAFSRTNELRAEFAQLSKHQADLYLPFGESASRARLLTALHESDKITERLAAQFADEGVVEEDEFVRAFREERTKYYKRAWVADRWAEGGLRWD